MSQFCSFFIIPYTSFIFLYESVVSPLNWYGWQRMVNPFWVNIQLDNKMLLKETRHNPCIWVMLCCSVLTFLIFFYWYVVVASWWLVASIITVQVLNFRKLFPKLFYLLFQTWHINDELMTNIINDEFLSILRLYHHAFELSKLLY